MGGKQKARPLLILIGAVGIPGPPQPKGFPKAQAVSVDHAVSRYGEAVQADRVDQRREVQTGLPFDAGKAQRIVRNVVAPLQDSVRFHPQVHALLKVQRAGHKGAARHHNGSAAFGAHAVDQGLKLRSLNLLPLFDPVVLHFVRFSFSSFGQRVIVKPRINCGSVGKAF